MRRTCTLLLCCSLLSGILPVHASVDAPLPGITQEAVITREQAALALYKMFAEDIVAKAAPKTTPSFLDIPAGSSLIPVLSTFCEAEAISCTGGDFQPDQPASMPAILKMYDSLLHYYTTAPMPGVPEEQRQQPEWNQTYMTWGQDHGLIPDGIAMIPVSKETLTYFVAQDAYLRDWHYALTNARLHLPVSLGDITDSTITTLDEVHNYRNFIWQSDKGLQERLTQDHTIGAQTRDSMARLRLAALDLGMQHLETFMSDHPLFYDASFTPEERAEFRKLGLKEIIGVGEYDFTTNPSYRKHNIRATLGHVHKVILQPNEEFDYWKLMYAKGMEDVVNGWLIVEGKEVWGWGGGLCGTATAIFRGAWFSGLEITERRPHTNYYRGLYGPDMGLDATVYQDSPNLRFKNNTGNPLMIYLRYNETQDDAKVMILGTKHFTDFQFIKGTRRGNGITHERVITMNDGTVWDDKLYSAYAKVE